MPSGNSWSIRLRRWWGGALGDQLEQPDSGYGPMPANRRLADAECVGDLLMLESDEIAQLHHLGFYRIFPGQDIQRFMHQQKLVVFIRRGDSGFMQFHSFLVAAALELAMASGIVHEDPAHRFGGCGEEVRPIFK